MAKELTFLSGFVLPQRTELPEGPVVRVDHEEEQVVAARKSGRKPKYPWETWMDGKWHEVDNEVVGNIHVFRAYLYTYARRHNLQVRTHLTSPAILSFSFGDED